MQVVGEDQFVHLPCELSGVIAAEGAEALAGAGNNVSGARCGVAALELFLVDAGVVDDELELFVDGIHVFHLDAGDLDALAVSDEDGPVAVFFSDLRDADHGFGIDHAAGNTNTGSGLASHLGIAKGILFKLF